MRSASPHYTWIQICGNYKSIHQYKLFLHQNPSFSQIPSGICTNFSARLSLTCYHYKLYARWCDENYETLHIQAVISQNMEVDFSSKTFNLTDKLTGEVTTIVVFVAIRPYSQ